MSYISNISKFNTSLKPEEISGLLYILKNTKSITNSDLIRKTGIPKEELRRFKSSISNLLEISNDDSIRLSNYGITELNKEELLPYTFSLKDYSFEFTEKEKEVISIIKNIRIENRMEQKREYDQWFATPETTVLKAKVLYSKGCVLDKNILLIGDDDLVSIALSMLYPQFQKLVVLDIDKSLLEIIEKFCSDHTIKNVSTSVYDITNPLPDIFYHQCDVVVIDPPYTSVGVTAFLNRSLESLKAFKGYVFLYYGNSFKSPEKFLDIQSIVTRMGFLIEDKVDKFAKYIGAESIGSSSSLYVLKNTLNSKLIPLFDFSKMYTYEPVPSDKNARTLNHYVFKLFNVPVHLLKTKNITHGIFDKFFRKHKIKYVDLKIIDTKEGNLIFSFILSNGSFIVYINHTTQTLYIDFITNNVVFNNEDMCVNMSELFSTKHLEYTEI